MKLIYLYNSLASPLVEKGVPVKKIIDSIKVVSDIIRSKATIPNNALEKYDEIEKTLRAQFEQLSKEVSS
jgi:V/A-type H+-transporting ATPase subunit A